MQHCQASRLVFLVSLVVVVAGLVVDFAGCEHCSAGHYRSEHHVALLALDSYEQSDFWSRIGST